MVSKHSTTEIAFQPWKVHWKKEVEDILTQLNNSSFDLIFLLSWSNNLTQESRLLWAGEMSHHVGTCPQA